MKVVVPYTYVDSMVHALILEQAPEAEFVPMTNDNSYWELLCHLWEKREDVIIVEHDIIPWPDCLMELDRCPFLWCSNSYQMRGGYGIHHAFGCTKFCKELMNMLPDVWTQVDSTKWNTLDAQLCEFAKVNGPVTPHPHRPPVTHLKKYYETHATEESQQALQV